MNLHLTGHVARDATNLVDTLLDDEPAIIIEGPRGSGKSTLLAEIAARRGAVIIDLDDEATLALVRQDATTPLTAQALVVVDEFQRAPEVLSVVKRVVDRRGGAGRFLLAGSVSWSLLPIGTETLTGRAHRLVLPPLSVGEILETPERWLGLILDSGVPPMVRSNVTRPQVFEFVAAGGYPAALRRPSAKQRHRWFASYLAAVADRDLPTLADVRHPGAVSRLYRLVAEQTASLPSVASLATQLDVRPETARSYLDLLTRVWLVHELPAWTVGLSAKVARRAKLHVTDTGLAAAALGLDAGRLAASAAGGGLVETFVLNELTKQAGVIDEPLTLAHFRDHSGVEVDVIIERADGTVIAIEIKSATTVSAKDTHGLTFLRERLGKRFVAGIVFHTGPLTGRLNDRIWGTPISALWGGAPNPSGSV